MRTVILKAALLIALFVFIGVRPARLSQSVAGLCSHTLRVLVAGEPFALALRQMSAAFEAELNINIELEIVGYADTRELTLSNAQDIISNYDLVSFDGVWLGEYVEQGALMPIGERAAQSSILNMDDFLQPSLQASRWNGELYGLPIQPHPELLWYRADWFAKAHLDPPRTTDDVLRAARILHNPEAGRYGICWNAQQGDVLAQQMAHFFAAFGQPMLDGDQHPTVDTPRGLMAAQYALELLGYAPPDILNMGWDQNITRFAHGACAMTYDGAARLAWVEAISPDLIPYIGFAAAPHASDADPLTPMITWSLGIPSNIGENAEIAWLFLEWLSAPEQQKRLAESGNAGLPRYSLVDDPFLAARYKHFSLIIALDEKGQLAAWIHPEIAEWHTMADIIGTRFSDMLRGELSAQQAVTHVQRELEALLQP